jgi:DNA polymerase III delta prime subunit
MNNLWYKKYRPDKFEELALSTKNKLFFKELIKNKKMGDFLFYSPGSGLGKTSLAKILPEILNKEVLFLNASKDGNIDTIKNDMIRFATFSSILNDGKIIILDEAERLSTAAQESLRGILEEEKYSHVNYIFTVNNKNALIDPLSNSRLLAIDFTLPKFEKDNINFIKDVFTPIFKYLCKILDLEQVKYNKNELPSFIHNEYPNIRQMVQKLQFSVFNKELNLSLNNNNNNNKEDLYSTLIQVLKSKNNYELKEFVDYLFDNKIQIEPIVDKYYNNLEKLYTINNFFKIIPILNEFQINNKLNLTYPKINFLNFLNKLNKINFI